MIQARRLPDVQPPPVLDDPAILEAYLEDSSASSPGSAAGLVRILDEAQAASLLRRTAGTGRTVLVQAARSSLTGGAVPQGELVLSVERMNRIQTPERWPGGARLSVQPGVRLDELQRELQSQGLYYPPVPTYQQAMIGGTVSCNAGGAATFKYGVTRSWVEGLRVLLSNGDLLELERGQFTARSGQSFQLRLSDGTERLVPVPDYELPALKKISAGYHAADPLDLVDLFVGAEGTLGLITSVTLKVIPRPAAVVTALVWLDNPATALRLSDALREAAQNARARRDPAGPDVRAIEWMDEASLGILRSHDEGRKRRIEIPGTARSALLFEQELPEPISNERFEQQLSSFLEGQAEEGPLARLFGILSAHQALDALEVAFPEDPRRHQALVELREALPTRVSEMLSARRREAAGVHKVAGDLIVPVNELPQMVAFYERGFARRGLPFAIWGHLSDGNLHPNALPENAEQTKLGWEAQLDFAQEAVRRGGCPLSEHGVGRSPLKQEILRRFLGESAIETMRRIKRALDPEGRFAPGVLFVPQ